jgi:hypothetical protein
MSYFMLFHQYYMRINTGMCHLRSRITNLYLTTYIRGTFEKFVDSPYYSESELLGGAMTVSFSKYLPWQAMHFLKRSSHLSKT